MWSRVGAIELICDLRRFIGFPLLRATNEWIWAPDWTRRLRSR